MSILIVMEQRGGAWNRMSFETLAAAQQLARELNTTASAAVLGQGVEALAGELAGKQLEKIYVVEHELLKEYTPDAYTSALRQLLAQVKPEYVLLPHTYQVRDFLPKLATALGTVAVSDVVAHRVDSGAVVLVRQLFQGKVNSDVRFTGAAPHFASLQAGAYRADQVVEGSAAVEKFTPAIAAGEVRTKPHGALPGIGARGGSERGRTDRVGGPRHQGSGEYCADPGIGQRTGRGTGRVAAHLRCRLAPHGAAGGQFGTDRRAEDVHGDRHFRCDPAPGGNEGVAHHRGDQ